MIAPYLGIGAAMGWTPAAVRACSLADISAAFDGWLTAQGVDLDDAAVALSTDDYREILAEVREHDDART